MIIERTDHKPFPRNWDNKIETQILDIFPLRSCLFPKYTHCTLLCISLVGLVESCWMAIGSVSWEDYDDDDDDDIYIYIMMECISVCE